VLDLSQDGNVLLTVLLAVAVGFQLLLTLYMAASLRIAERERARLNRDVFGLLKKIEGLTSSRREQMLRHYDKILEQLSVQLPPAIAEEAGQLIFDTESKILTRLAELEPDLKNDSQSREKLDELIKSMESLEATIVSLTANTVQSIMARSRKDLFSEAIREDRSLAA